MQFLFELSVEEIPARMQRQAGVDFKNLFMNAFLNAGIACDNVKSFITPRRQTVVANIAACTQEISESRRGPKEGAPQGAIDGFLKSTGLSIGDLTLEKGYYYATIKKPAVDTKLLLSDIIESVLKNHPWPKVMRYPGSALPWVRPIRSILCIVDGVDLALNIPCIGQTTTNKTTAHRFMAPTLQTISSFEHYASFLSENFVVLDHAERQEIIKTALNKNPYGLEWIIDNALLEEVAGLVEYPFVYIGQIGEEFMHLPECVLTTSMRVHQKYFAFKDPKTNQLAPYFGVVTNFKPQDNSIMMKGFEKVLRARLTDASFFYALDSKTPLAGYDSHLSKIVYQNQLGTLKDKLSRMKNNTYFDMTPELSQAIDLSKSDLLTQMVGEFPELQGKMGHIYAKNEGLNLEVAQSLETYYLPQGPEDSLPSPGIAMNLSLLDKMDALVGFLKIGFKPSGSKDPYALRRQALGVIRILLTQKDHDLRSLILKTVQTYAADTTSLTKDVEDFILDRFYHLMQNMYPKDVISAVLKTIGSTSLNFWILEKRIEALHIFLKTESGDLLKQIYKRALGVAKDAKSTIVNESLFETAAESQLWAVIQKAELDSLSAIKNDDYSTAFHVLQCVKDPLYTFFEQVLVNVEKQEIKENRQALIKRFVDYVQSLADLG